MQENFLISIIIRPNLKEFVSQAEQTVINEQKTAKEVNDLIFQK